MGKLKTQGLDKFADDLRRAGADLPQVQSDMLDAGAQATVEAWKDGIERAGHKDTGDMQKSVRASKRSRGTERAVAPQGKDRKDVRNAEKAFILHYGSSSIVGDRFVDKIEEKADEAAAQRMDAVLTAHLRQQGLL